MLYLPFNVYLDSKRVSILIEAVFANITNAVPSLQCISWFKESKHTHRSSFCQHYQCCIFPLMYISWFKESKHTHRSSFCQHYQCCIFPSMYINITNAVPSLQCISWFKESKHAHRSSFCQHQCCIFPLMYINITNGVPSLLIKCLKHHLSFP